MPQAIQSIQGRNDDNGLEVGAGQVLDCNLEDVLHKLGLVMLQLAPIAKSPEFELVPGLDKIYNF